MFHHRLLTLLANLEKGFFILILINNVNAKMWQSAALFVVSRPVSKKFRIVKLICIICNNILFFANNNLRFYTRYLRQL